MCFFSLQATEAFLEQVGHLWWWGFFAKEFTVYKLLTVFAKKLHHRLVV